jgi:hypothetical protein
MTPTSERGTFELPDHEQWCALHRTGKEDFTFAAGLAQSYRDQQIRCILAVSRQNERRWLSGLSKAGFEVNAASRSGNFSVLFREVPAASRETLSEALQQFQPVVNKGHGSRPERVRIIGDLGSLIGDQVSVAHWMPLKLQLDSWMRERSAGALWFLDESKTAPELLKAVLYSHDRFLHEGHVCLNPLRIPAEELAAGLNPQRELDLLRSFVARYARELTSWAGTLKRFEQENQLLKLETHERQRLEQELQQKLARYHSAIGFLTLCSRCKRLRDEQGRWEPIDAYFNTKMGIQTSHGLCPDCARKLFPEVGKS